MLGARITLRTQALVRMHIMTHAGMAGLLGKAAASNWKRATFGKAEATETVDWRAMSLELREQRAAATHLSSAALDAASRIIGEADVSIAGGVGDAAMVVGAATAAGTREGGQGRCARVSTISDVYSQQPRAAQVTAERKPERVSKDMIGELAGRASIDAVLSQMEKAITRQGPARRLGRADSRQITKAINRSMMAGASKHVRSASVYMPCFCLASWCTRILNLLRATPDAVVEALRYC